MFYTKSAPVRIEARSWFDEAGNSGLMSPAKSARGWRLSADLRADHTITPPQIQVQKMSPRGLGVTTSKNYRAFRRQGKDLVKESGGSLGLGPGR